MHQGIEQRIAPYPFPIKVHLYRRDSRSGPVPWAHTWRENGQHLVFYVDTRYSMQRFRDDWTASHEFAHLLLPYLGSNKMWFAEGFASYLQYSLMSSYGALSPEAAARRREKRLKDARKDLDDLEKPLAQVQQQLRERGNYPLIHWGGANYFWEVDKVLISNGTSIEALLRSYLNCCRGMEQDFEALIAQLDSMSGQAAFSRQLPSFE